MTRYDDHHGRLDFLREGGRDLRLRQCRRQAWLHRRPNDRQAHRPGPLRRHEFGGFLGIDTDRYPIPWNVLKYDTTKDGYVVPLDKSRLQKAPKYQFEDVPAYDAT